MTQAKGARAPILDNAALPFGMTWDCPAFERACALARTVLGVESASIILVHEGRVMRSVDPEGKMAPVGGSTPVAIERGKTVWMDDTHADPVASKHPMVVGAPFIRFSTAAPIILSDGSILGALAAFGPEPKRYDPQLKARLEDIAAFVADEVDRARTALTLAEREARLRNTEKVLEVIVEVLPVSLMVTDENLNLKLASRRFLNNISSKMEDALGKCAYDLHPAFESFRQVYGRVMSGETFHADRGKWLEPDGKVRWLRSELAPMFGDGGEVTGMVSVSLDITDVVETLRRAEKAEQRMNLAAELADLHVWEIDYQKKELVVGGAGREEQLALFGRHLTFDDLATGTSVTIHPDDRAGLDEVWEKAVLDGRKFIAEYRVNRPDDKEVWTACSVQLTRDREGNPRGLIGAMQNITARKKAEVALIQAKEDAEAANKAKSAFLATMSHEIRTPLNGVLGMAQAMAADGLDNVQRERLTIIRQSGETLLALLNDVLDLSKIEAGKLDLEMAEFDLEDVAHGSHAAFAELARGKGLAFSLAVSDAARGVYRSDSTRLRQILYNLVSNAIKFTEKGHVDVSIDRAGGELVLTISDTGIGIPADRLGSLFQKFEQADTSTTRRFGGTGLGLAICRELTDLMGGRIEARSTEGQGTTFEVFLPVERTGDARSAVATESDAAGAVMDTTELRVLAAEDNAVNQLVLKTLLLQAGIEVTIVGNGRLAVEAWRAGEWDVILMDVQMPEMDGPTAAMTIRAEEAASGRAHTPIIALTANAMAHQVAEYHASGMDDFCAKPIEISQLFAALERVLDEPDGQSEALAS